MRVLSITATLDGVDFGPESEYIEILQNVKTFLTTTKFSVPLDREFGLDARMVDKPLPVAQAELTAEIVEALPLYEPRVRVVEVTYTGDAQEGFLVPTVKVVIA